VSAAGAILGEDAVARLNIGSGPLGQHCRGSG
jgi:hypothetical protein